MSSMQPILLAKPVLSHLYFPSVVQPEHQTH